MGEIRRVRLASADDPNAADGTAVTPTRSPESPSSKVLRYAEALQRVAELAPTLKEAELRTLLHLTATALADGATSVRASSRDIAYFTDPANPTGPKKTRVARSGVVEALDRLAARGVIATRPGTSTGAAVHTLSFLEVTTMGGLNAGPPLVLFPDHLGLNIGPPTREGGPVAGPPPIENTEVTQTATALDPDSDSIKTIDRVFSADPKNFERGELAKVRDVISYAAAKAHYPYDRDPDVRVCAQIFEACGRSHKALEWLALEIHRERLNPGASPVWWVTVALQRLSSIDHKTTEARRAELKAAKRPKLVRDSAAPTHATDDATSNLDLKRAIAAAAAQKRL